MARLHEEYIKKIKPNLMKELSLKNILSVPELKKIVINIGLGIDASDKKKLEATIEDLKKISGQMPIITKTKKAIANFKTKKDMPIGCKVTLRRKRMYEFIDRLINIALPRTKDFSGLSEKNFESYDNFRERVRLAKSKVSSLMNENRNTMVVSSGGAITGVYAECHPLTVDEIMKLNFKIKKCLL